MALKFTAKKMAHPIGVPRLSGYVVSAPKLSRSVTVCKTLRTQHGAALDLDDSTALARATSEAIERYCCFVYKSKHVKVATIKEMGRRGLHPKDFILYSEKQYVKRYFPYDSPLTSKNTYWIQASLLDPIQKIKKYIPIDFVYPKMTDAFEAARFDAWNSTGVAVARSLDDALINATYEVIERDSLMCWWFSRKNAYKLPSSCINISKKIKILERLICQIGGELRLYCIISEMGLVTIISCIESKSKPYYSFGTACKPGLASSIEHAIEESIMILRSQKILLAKGHKLKFSSVKTLTDHIMVPTDPGFSKVYQERFQQLPTVSLTSIKRVHKKHPPVLSALTKLLKKFGYEHYYVNIATTEVTRAGYSTCRVLIPGFHPLEIMQSRLHFDTRRLLRFTGAQVDGRQQYEAFPHPFG